VIEPFYHMRENLSWTAAPTHGILDPCEAEEVLIHGEFEQRMMKEGKAWHSLLEKLR
jgi:hypothetical protein